MVIDKVQTAVARDDQQTIIFDGKQVYLSDLLKIIKINTDTILQYGVNRNTQPSKVLNSIDGSNNTLTYIEDTSLNIIDIHKTLKNYKIKLHENSQN
jgi:hypothetical protein